MDKNIEMRGEGFGLEDLATRFNPLKIYRGILRRSWLLVITSLISALGFGLFTLHLKSMYTASSYLMFEPVNEKILPQGFPISHFTMASAVEMVTLPVHLNAVRTILGLELTEQQLLEMIHVKPPMGDSNLINISVSADHPSLAIDISNSLAAVVVKDAQEFTKKQLRAAFDYLHIQATELQGKIDAKIKEIALFRKEYPFLEISSEGVTVARRFQETEKELQDVSAEYKSSLIKFENVRREAARLPDQIVKAEDSPLKQRLSQAQLNLLRAKARYASENPKIKFLEAEIEEIQKSLSQKQEDLSLQYEKNPLKDQLNLDLLHLRGKLRSFQKRKEDLEELYHAQQKQQINLAENELLFARLNDQKHRYEEELRQTEAIKKVADMLIKMGKGDIDLYANASKAHPEDSFMITLLPLVGFLLGLGVGIALATFLEITDNKLRTAQELEKCYNLPCLLTVPEMSRWRSFSEERLSVYISYLESLLSRSLNSPFVLALTSSTSGEGKTTLTRCLAHYWQSLGKAVLLIHLDVEEQKNEKSLESYLRGEIELKEAICKEVVPCITSDGSMDKSMVRKGGISQLLQKLRSEYEIILLDSPGILSREYSLSLLEIADYSLFVVGSSRTCKKYIDKSLRECEIAGISPIGFILNRALKIFIDDLFVEIESSKNPYHLLRSLFLKNRR